MGVKWRRFGGGRGGRRCDVATLGERVQLRYGIQYELEMTDRKSANIYRARELSYL